MHEGTRHGDVKIRSTCRKADLQPLELCDTQAPTAVATSSSRSVAGVGGSAARAGRGACRRPRHTWLTHAIPHDLVRQWVLSLPLLLRLMLAQQLLVTPLLQVVHRVSFKP